MSTVTVGDLIDEGFASIQTGPFGTQLKAAEYTDKGRPLLNVKNVGFGEVRVEGLEFVSDETAERLRAHILEVEDIVFGRKGAVERHAFIPAAFAGAVQGSDCIRLRLDRRRVLPRFASFALRTEAHRVWMQNQSSHGATMASLNQDIVRRIEIPALPLDVQKRVVRILGAVDDLIENNRRRIALLERMAQAIYREWFVHFRYPGHEDDELVDSPLGPIPTGWGVRDAGEFLDLDKGVSYKGAFLDDNGVPMVNLKCFGPDGGFRFDALKGYSGPTKAQHSVRSGDLVMANTDLTQAGTIVGRVAIVPPVAGIDELLVSHHVFAVRPRSWPPSFLVHVLSDERFRNHARATASGTTVLGLRRDDVLAYPMLDPPSARVEAFVGVAEAVQDQQTLLFELIRRLELLRDLLLPKLVTGAIDVSKVDLDALFEEPAA